MRVPPGPVRTVTPEPVEVATGPDRDGLWAPVATSTGSGVTVRTGPGGTRIVSYRDN